MYSLYRAWFGDTSDNYSRLQETLSPPDTVVRVGNEGEHQFVAHKGVLAAHSGYLKALLTSAATTSNQLVNGNIGGSSTLPATAIAVSATNLSSQSARQPVTSVSVSSIGGEAFAPLLNYMYTGRLEVTLDNVYSVLLATHLLHMPGALEQCRAALLRLRAPPPAPPPPPLATPIPMPTGPTSTLTSTSMSTSTPTSGSILRPIPNRLMIDHGMCWPPTAPLYAPTAPAPGSIGIPHLSQLQPSVLMQSTTVPLSVSIVPTSNVQDTPASTAYSEASSIKASLFQMERNRGSRVDSRGKSPETVSSSSLPFVAAATAAAAAAAATAFTAFTTSNAATSTRTSSPCRSVSPAPSSMSQSSIPACQGKKSSDHHHHHHHPHHRRHRHHHRQRQDKPENEYERANAAEQSHNRFPSVASSAEEPTGSRGHDRSAEVATSNPENDRGKSPRRRGRGSNAGSDGSSGVLSVVYDVACCDGPVKFHRVLNENYSSSTASCGPSSVPQARFQRQRFEADNASSENDENGRPPRDVAGSCDPAEPAGIDAANNGGTASYTCGYCRHTFKSQYCYRKHTKRHLLPTRVNDSAGNRQRQDVGRNRREVRLLDLNVQYYPCKICGCKFPSYYFVHKHRKLCHANAEERTQSDEANSTATEDQESTTSTTNNDRQ